MTNYFFDHAHERRRLEALGALHDPDTIEYLDRIGIAPGWQCLEVGAGSGSIARWMNGRVGRDGRVTATDIDTRVLEVLASQHIEVLRHDIARDQLARDSFDLIHTRAVLQHVPDREIAIDRMVAALKPGGWIVLEDVVMPHAACHPELPVWSKMLSAMERGLRSAGANPYYGLELRTALQRRELLDVRCEARVSMMYSGTRSIDFVMLSVEQVGARFVDAGALTAREVEELLAALRTPGYTMTSAIMLTVSGRARGG